MVNDNNMVRSHNNSSKPLAPKQLDDTMVNNNSMMRSVGFDEYQRQVKEREEELKKLKNENWSSSNLLHSDKPDHKSSH